MHSSWKPNVENVYVGRNNPTEGVMIVFFHLSLCAILGRKNISCRTEPLIQSLVHSATFVVVLQADKNCESSPVKSLCLPAQGSVDQKGQFFDREATLFLQGISDILNRLWNMMSKETRKFPTLGSVLQSPRNPAAGWWLSLPEGKGALVQIFPLFPLSICVEANIYSGRCSHLQSKHVMNRTKGIYRHT